MPGLNPYVPATSAVMADLLGGMAIGTHANAFTDLDMKGVAGSWLVVTLITFILTGMLISGALKTGFPIGSVVSPKVLQETMNSEACQ